MQTGMIGLGRMEANMAHPLVQRGHACLAYDPRPEPCGPWAATAPAGWGSLAELIGALERPLALWIMVPTGRVDTVIQELRPLLSPGDVLIDGGNSHYHDDIRRSGELKGEGIHYVDVGTSGGARLRAGLLPDGRGRRGRGGTHRTGAGNAGPRGQAAGGPGPARAASPATAALGYRTAAHPGPATW